MLSFWNIVLQLGTGVIIHNYVLDPNDPNYLERKNWERKEFDSGRGGYYGKRNLKFILRDLQDNDKINDSNEQDITFSNKSIYIFIVCNKLKKNYCKLCYWTLEISIKIYNIYR